MKRAVFKLKGGEYINVVADQIDVNGEWVARLDEWGYYSKWQVINGTDFEMPQNRKRCFMVSVLGDYYYQFPYPKGCTLRLKDLLGDKVDEKYYLTKQKIEQIEKWNAQQDPLKNIEKEKLVSPCIKEPKIAEVVGGIGEKKSNGGTQYYQQDRIYEGNVAVALSASLPSGSNYYVTKESAKYIGTYEYHNSDTFMNGKSRFIQDATTSSCILTKHCNGVAYSDLRIRKLTERECFRLMGVKDEDFDCVAKNQSAASLYHLAGDSIITNCLMAIFKEMI